MSADVTIGARSGAILPIAIEGTADALPKRGFVLQGRHPIRITILDVGFREIAHFLATGEELPEPTVAEIRDVLLDHLVNLHQLGVDI